MVSIIKLEKLDRVCTHFCFSQFSLCFCHTLSEIDSYLENGGALTDYVLFDKLAHTMQGKKLIVF